MAKELCIDKNKLKTKSQKGYDEFHHHENNPGFTFPIPTMNIVPKIVAKNGVFDEVEFAEIKERGPEPKAPSREELKRINWDYWQENRELYPKWFRSKNEEVMSLLLQGYPVADCYKRVLDRGETQGSKDIKPKKNAKKLKKFRRRV